MDVLGQIFLNSIVSFSIYAIFGAGFTLLYGIFRFVDMSYASVSVIAAYVLVFFVRSLGFNLYLSLFFGLLAGVMVGYLIFRFIFLPLRKRGAPSLVLFLTSLGVFTFFQALISILFGVSFYTLERPDWMGASINLFYGTVTGVQALVFCAAIILFLVTSFLLYRTSFGRMVRAVFDDEEVSSIVGINTGRVMILVTVIAHVFASLGGMFFVLDVGVNTTTNLWILLSAVSSAIVGGLTVFPGAYLGALVLGLAENIGVWFLPGEWKQAIAVLVLLVFLLFRPSGILRR